MTLFKDASSSKLKTKLRNELEASYLQKNSFIVNVLLILIVIPIYLLLINYGFSQPIIFGYTVFFFAIFFINLALYTYRSYFDSLKISIYITTMAIYVLASSLILLLQTASIFFSLFIAYAIVSLYQDAKATIINNISIFLVGILTLVNYGDVMFGFSTSDSILSVYMYIYLVVFIILVSLASSVFIKRKMQFYDKLAEVQEIELRAINVMLNLKKEYDNQEIDSDFFIKNLETFLNEFLKKHEMSNVFQDHLKKLKEINSKNGEHHKSGDLSINNDEINKLKLSANSKFIYLAYKIGLSQDKDVDKVKILSKTPFKSLKHYDDDLYTRIITFAVLYVSLRAGSHYLKALSNDEVRELLLSDEFGHLVDLNVKDIYMENSEVFDKIFEDTYAEGKA